MHCLSSIFRFKYGNVLSSMKTNVDFLISISLIRHAIYVTQKLVEENMIVMANSGNQPTNT